MKAYNFTIPAQPDGTKEVVYDFGSMQQAVDKASFLILKNPDLQPIVISGPLASVTVKPAEAIITDLDNGSIVAQESGI